MFLTHESLLLNPTVYTFIKVFKDFVVLDLLFMLFSLVWNSNTFNGEQMFVYLVFITSFFSPQSSLLVLVFVTNSVFNDTRSETRLIKC